MDEKARENLVSLKNHGDLEVAEGEPDIRAWDVIGPDGRKVGHVDDLIVDEAQMKVRYLTVGLDPAFVKDSKSGKGQNSVDVPIDRAQLRRDQRYVVLDSQVGEFYGTEPFGTRDYAGRSSHEYGTERGRETAIPRSEEELRVGKRRTQTGEVVVGKHTETERVSTPVTREREEVIVDRRPATGDTPREARIGENEEIRMPVFEEEPVVEKRPVVKEEVIIGKQKVEEKDRVETDLRKERVDVERHKHTDRDKPRD
jgi:uncharacterized protein (TIGR02271 family)